MKKEKKEKIVEQVKRDRAARRQVALELKIPQEKHKIHKTHKRDIEEKGSNTVVDTTDWDKLDDIWEEDNSWYSDR